MNKGRHPSIIGKMNRIKDDGLNSGINFISLSFSLFLIVFFFASSAEAQTYQNFRSEREQIIKDTWLKFGPFRLSPRIRLLDIGYDDNVYYQREEDEPVSDYTATISPEVRVNLLLQDFLIISFTENPEYVFYYKEKRERRWNNSLSPEFKLLLFHRFVLSGNYFYQNRRRRATSEFDIRANELRRGYSGRFFYETARQTSFGFATSKEKVSYEDVTQPEAEIPLSRALNRDELSGNFEFYYQVFSRSFFFIRVGYTAYEFEHRETRWRNADSYQVMGGIQFPILGRVMGVLSLGYKELEPRAEGKRGFSGLVGNTDVDFRVGRFRIRVRYNRDSRFSYYSNNIFFIEDVYGTGVSFYLTSFLRLDYDFSYKEADYPEPMWGRTRRGDYEMIRREDLYRIHSAGFVFRLIRNTGLGIRINYWERESNLYWANRDRWFVGGYLTYQF